ncbi:interleukin-8-like [Gymnodraco acuticeps]|uniref:Interleukin-8-like n=1 Tax=Gymnodraco acuticeps TaxID=8218 RepID=A0A6P8TTF2_GYMAC|nr:interleukin-8-like [Gymnodraco acuticeps]
MYIITIVALLFFLTISEGISLGNWGGITHCRCVGKEKKPIGRYIGRVEVKPAGPHCEDIEIIATLKKNGQQICLDPNAPWVKRVLKRKPTGQQGRTGTTNQPGTLDRPTSVPPAHRGTASTYR